jgi:hypothetical protein
MVNYLRYHEKPIFWFDGQGTEAHFYDTILPKKLGFNYERYVIPQIDLATLTTFDVGQKEQRFKYSTRVFQTTPTKTHSLSSLVLHIGHFQSLLKLGCLNIFIISFHLLIF